jgi:hypothetical protein
VLKLKLVALTEEVARGQSIEIENLLLKEVIEADARALMAKNNEISALQATTAFLMKRCNSVTKLAQSAAVPAEAGSQASTLQTPKRKKKYSNHKIAAASSFRGSKNFSESRLLQSSGSKIPARLLKKFAQERGQLKKLSCWRWRQMDVLDPKRILLKVVHTRTCEIHYRWTVTSKPHILFVGITLAIDKG